MVSCPGCGTRLFLPGDLAPLSVQTCSKCNTGVMIPMQLRQFELRSVIASGGMGTVYRSFDVQLEREVAVKLIKKELMNDDYAVSNFRREARAAAKLNHTNIIHVYTFDDFEGQLYLAMELADNGSLDGRIERGQVTELDVLDVGVKVASALDAALKKGLLHRDIKPGNILFNQDNEPKLVDFGLACNPGDDSEGDGTVWGTPYYIAPEKIQREGEDFRSDMYSLAGTLYHAITGHVPFEAPTIEDVVSAHVHVALTPPHEVVPAVTLPTSEALMKAMAKSPDQRYASYDEFIMALTAARSQYLVGHYRTQQPALPNVSSVKSVAKNWFRF